MISPESPKAIGKNSAREGAGGEPEEDAGIENAEKMLSGLRGALLVMPLYMLSLLFLLFAFWNAAKMEMNPGMVRKLLPQRHSSEQITALPAGRSTKETKRMFLGGIEMVARADGSPGVSGSPAPGPVETWRRIKVSSGVELHLRDDLPKLTPSDRKQVMERLERALRRSW